MEKRPDTYPAFFVYLPRKYEMTAPMNPNNPRLRMISPVGIPVVWELVSSVKEGTSMGGGGVKVGNRVGVVWPMNAASNVGLMVGVESGVGVGGISTVGRMAPGERKT